MKRKIIISSIIALLLSLVICIGVFASTEPSIAKVGKYEMTKSDFKTFAYIAGLEQLEEISLQSCARLYAQNQIVMEEIAQTKYEIPSKVRAELIRTEREKFKSDYEKSVSRCNELGMNEEEYIEAIVTSKINLMARLRHYRVFSERYYSEHNNGNKTTDDLSAEYDEYMEKRLNESTFVTLDAEELGRVESELRKVNALREESKIK